jgi:crotonobetainyl-CoA:carnitine CoA-transferase CaiB-like acyl-CoA transferase
VRIADVFSQGYRPGSLANRGLSREELAAIRPGLVYVSLCAFGHAGPWASRRGFHILLELSNMDTSVAGRPPASAPDQQRARVASRKPARVDRVASARGTQIKA